MLLFVLTQQFPRNKGEQTKEEGKAFFCLGELVCACRYMYLL